MKFPRAKFFLGGDFNTRLGLLDETLIGKIPELSTDLYLLWYFKRRTRDQMINQAGILLVKLIILLGLIMLSGCLSLDPLGEFTFISIRGCSIVDYCLVNSA